MPVNPPNTARNIWFAVGSFLALVPILLIYIYATGSHSGAEFSPDDFSRRSFTYNQSPWLDWVIHKKRYLDQQTSLEKSLVADGFITVRTNANKAWHLTRDSASAPDLISHECDARFLTQYLDLIDDRNNDGENFWIVWNQDYPRSAKVFWPLVADMARHEMYLRIPDVMRFAMDIKSDEPEKFLPRVKDLVASLYLELGTLDLELGHATRARTRLVRAKQLSQSPDKAGSELERCLEELGSDVKTEEEPPLELVIPPKEKDSEEDASEPDVTDSDTEDPA